MTSLGRFGLLFPVSSNDSSTGQSEQPCGFVAVKQCDGVYVKDLS